MSLPNLPKTGNAWLDFVLLLLVGGGFAKIGHLILTRVEASDKRHREEREAEAAKEKAERENAPAIISQYSSWGEKINQAWERQIAMYTARLAVVEQRVDDAYKRAETAERRADEMEARAIVAESQKEECETKTAELMAEIAQLKARVRVLESTNGVGS
jgi:chromosome segregation ATPase